MIHDDGVTNGREIGKSHPQDPQRSFSQRDPPLRRAMRLNRIRGAREGRDASARGACRPPSPIKGRDFTPLYLASARCLSLSPQKQPTISRLLMSVINGHLRVRRRRACAFQWRAMRETGRGRRETRGMR